MKGTGKLLNEREKWIIPRADDIGGQRLNHSRVVIIQDIPSVLSVVKG